MDRLEYKRQNEQREARAKAKFLEEMDSKQTGISDGQRGGKLQAIDLLLSLRSSQQLWRSFRFGS
jgi:hypothetical protein